MCWANNIAIPIVLKKPLRVYKVGTSTISGVFISLYHNFMYFKHEVMPTVEVNPKFYRVHISRFVYDIFHIYEGYHSYLTEEMAKCRRDEYDEIGIFEIPVGATIYVDYQYKEVVSTDIKYLGLLE